MIRRLRLLRNTGRFDSVDAAAEVQLGRLALVYAENGQGKTTLAAILRSLSTGDPTPILERRRLAAENPPHVVIDCDGGPPDAVFQDGTWNRTLPALAIFDDAFVDANVHSGLAIESRHRQNLHELVLGAQGVALSRQIQDLVARIEEHNRTLRERAAAIPEAQREGLTVDEFCALAEFVGVDTEVAAAERALAAARDADAVREHPGFETLALPPFDTDSLQDLLGRSLADLDEDAVARVQAHVAGLGAGGEQWLAEGVSRLPQQDNGGCPFCDQDLAGAPLVAHYRNYFSAAYEDLKEAIAAELRDVERSHGGNVPAGLERAVRVAGERQRFWATYCDVPEVTIDTAAIVRAWTAAREAVLAALQAKQAAPLDAHALDTQALGAIADFETERARLAEISRALIAANDAVQAAKEMVEGATVETLEQDLRRLRATRNRHTPETAALCDAYLAEKEAKALTETRRDQAKEALDEYRENAFPASQEAVNAFLRRFNAGFRLDSVTSTATRGGPTCTYSVLINDQPIPMAGGAAREGEPAFRNTLSAGDRNTLALAFFFAALDQDPRLGEAVVVIDDPISSLDDHRSLATVQEVRRLAARAQQVIVLSHDKRFLCRVWGGADRTERSALQITRDGDGSTIAPWNVDSDSVTEHDRRHARLHSYVDTGQTQGDLRDVARDLRPHLEAYLRVARPGHFPPGTLLGPFIGTCRGRVGQQGEILDQARLDELDSLREYVNRFHHDTNAAWETEVINDAELRGFAERTLRFVTS